MENNLYVCIYIWVILPNIMSSSSTHFAANDRILFILGLNSIPLHIYLYILSFYQFLWWWASVIYFISLFAWCLEGSCMSQRFSSLLLFKCLCSASLFFLPLTHLYFLGFVCGVVSAIIIVENIFFSFSFFSFWRSEYVCYIFCCCSKVIGSSLFSVNFLFVFQFGKQLLIYSQSQTLIDDP